jgi:hypothetical protein
MIMQRFFIRSLALSLTYIATFAFCEENFGKQYRRATLRHIESGGIGYDNGYTTLEAFLASDPNRWAVTPFLDARGHVFDDGRWAANAGIGLRTILGKRAYGINTYYDYRNTRRLNFNQIGLGLETLGELFDFRINGYLPVGKKLSTPWDTTFAEFSGHHLLLSSKYQFAMKGADAEFGFHFGGLRNFDFYAATGPYYFTGEIGPHVWGGKARIGGTYKDLVTLELSDSYDSTFQNKFQGQISLNFSFGPKSQPETKGSVCTCKLAHALNKRMVQPVGRQEIIVIDQKRENSIAIDPDTGLPYFFVFVNNTSSSDGSFESPYHSLAQAQENSSPNDIIYVFPGDGTTTGMDSGIFLKENQKFWGSGISHSIQTSEGTVSLPAQSTASPTITNTNIDTEGNAITLAAHNAISGLTITSAMNDAIFGTDLQSLEVSSCTIENTTTYSIQASFSGNASVSLTNNQLLNNVNGIFLTLNGTSTVVCSNNTFKGQTSISSVPVEIAASNNIFAAYLENNIFDDNITGGVRLGLNNVTLADLILLNNTITNNGTGSQSSLGSSLVILSTGTIQRCSIAMRDNTFSGNTSNSLYLHTSGQISTLEITASTNTMSANGGSALVLATPVDILTLVATDNTITGCNDNGIAVISGSSTSTGNITINNNTIQDIGNSSNGIAINQDFSTLHLTILSNEINGCEGTGIVSYSPTGISSFILDISDNTITDCQNLSSNAASGLDIEQFTNLAGSVTNNSLSGNTGLVVAIGSTLSSPTACLTLTGNDNSAEYLLTNPGDGLFNLAPCNVDVVNVGTINISGTIAPVQSCPGAIPCPP